MTLEITAICWYSLMIMIILEHSTMRQEKTSRFITVDWDGDVNVPEKRYLLMSPVIVEQETVILGQSVILQSVFLHRTNSLVRVEKVL